MVLEDSGPGTGGGGVQMDTLWKDERKNKGNGVSTGKGAGERGPVDKLPQKGG